MPSAWNTALKEMLTAAMTKWVQMIRSAGMPMRIMVAISSSVAFWMKIFSSGPGISMNASMPRVISPAAMLTAILMVCIMRSRFCAP